MPLFAFARSCSLFQYFLDGFKSHSGNNCRKTAFIAFAVMDNYSEINFICQHSLQSRFADRFSGSAHHAPKTQALAQTFQSVSALRKFLKRFSNTPRLCRFRLNRSCFGIIHIAERRKAGPFATPEFLSNPALYIFRQIVGIVFGLAKGDLKHKKPLRSWLKPKSGKAQRNDLADVYAVNYLSAVNGISCQAEIGRASCRERV